MGLFLAILFAIGAAAWATWMDDRAIGRGIDRAQEWRKYRPEDDKYGCE